ncbi:hypothetical protein K493DRAFT_311764 [Basidiobolus meristosporus CBS 931.73]|uniref:Arrestin C-terminal-like domain-containing protein n=1 Tax=Basidiobolus meristosporus CBS 931.73 TaxID=1314790 RepID=A0A1Y1YZC9_9FUNG|nr:hypothetical protein K493DRAFT_321972 [Basidiobolus meristosporus CBS 931.73]ORY03403.1 hypothetical protein K493DRAFT_311764 [Basidiobolus meristosporus CBS 931.73]|eukprot:ORX64509.1 hypothetical protein K493DRAFT_321972 [Basidiobolus meristosporus CBS 931.73]
MSPKLQIQLDQDTFYKREYEEGGASSMLKGKLVFCPSSSIKVVYINLSFRGKLTMAKGFQTTRKTFFEHTWTFHHDVGSTLFDAQQYTYDFDLPLPSDLPESCVADYARVEYSLKATVETPLFYSNIRTDKAVFIHKNNSQLLSVAYNTHIQNSWKDMIDYEVVIPSHEYIPGDSFPVTLKHVILDPRCKLVNVWAGLNEKTIYNKADGSPGDDASCVKKWLHTTTTEILEGSEQSYLSLTVPKSSKNVHFDSSTPYVEVLHSLYTRIEVEVDGKIEQIRSILPVCVVRHTVGSEETQMYEPLPTYEIIKLDCPPTYATSKCVAIPQAEAPPAYIQ